MYDLISLGELLIDFTPKGKSENGNNLYEMNPGGAPANVCAAVAKLGKKAAFLGKVGDDHFGRFLAGELSKLNINIKGLRFTKDSNTTLAFVHLNDKGDRSFSFYRENGADTLMEKSDVDLDKIRHAKVFHFGSVSMTKDPSRTATLYAAEYAKEHSVLVSYDPNLRPALWDSLNLTKTCILEGFRYADIVKLSEEELMFLTGNQNFEAGAEFLEKEFGTRLILVSLGPQGCYFRFKGKGKFMPTYDVRAVDTTGAGDAFLGGLLYKVLDSQKTLGELDFEQMSECVNFANLVGALTTTKKGAIPALPTMGDIQNYLSSLYNAGK
jgi:fructokinase